MVSTIITRYTDHMQFSVTRCLPLSQDTQIICSLQLIQLFRLSHSFILFGFYFYHCIYGCVFCVFLVDFVNYVFLFLCLCILIVMYVPFWVFCFIVLFCKLFVCKCVLCCTVLLQPGVNPTAVNKISYHIIYIIPHHIIYIISYHIQYISYHITKTQHGPLHRAHHDLSAATTNFPACAVHCFMFFHKHGRTSRTIPQVTQGKTSCNTHRLHKWLNWITIRRNKEPNFLRQGNVHFICEVKLSVWIASLCRPCRPERCMEFTITLYSA